MYPFPRGTQLARRSCSSSSAATDAAAPTSTAAAGTTTDTAGSDDAVAADDEDAAATAGALLTKLSAFGCHSSMWPNATAFERAQIGHSMPEAVTVLYGQRSY